MSILKLWFEEYLYRTLPLLALGIGHSLLHQRLVPLHGGSGQNERRIGGGICGLVDVDGCK